MSTDHKIMDMRDLNTGAIVSVRSSVVDARFPRRLPAINNLLRAEGGREVVIEVLGTPRLGNSPRNRPDAHPGACLGLGRR
jgi:hypothetical protein